ncbi:MAG: flagellar basal-body rod protein FlgF [Pseudomonadota bacterium]
MENTQLVGLSRQVALRRELDVVANNLANINTAGFKRHSVLFQEYMMPVAESGAPYRMDRPVSYVRDRATMRDFSAGAIEQTGNPYDVAINGTGWFAIETADGERYTRNGSFTVDNTGRLVTHEGNPVVGDAGPIVVPANATNVAIARDGSISSDGENIGQLRVVNFENEADVLADQGTLFRSDAVPQPNLSPRVIQGAIERSNVNGTLEVTRLIEVTRAYESLARAMERTDQLRRSTIQRLGEIQSA